MTATLQQNIRNQWFTILNLNGFSSDQHQNLKEGKSCTKTAEKRTKKPKEMQSRITWQHQHHQQPAEPAAWYQKGTSMYQPSHRWTLLMGTKKRLVSFCFLVALLNVFFPASMLSANHSDCYQQTSQIYESGCSQHAQPFPVLGFVAFHILFYSFADISSSFLVGSNSFRVRLDTDNFVSLAFFAWITSSVFSWRNKVLVANQIM